MQASRRHLLIAAFAAAVPCVHAATLPASVLLSNVWDDSLDPAGYLVSEKFDGVRAVWDGTALRFRSGRPVAAPGWFTARLPSASLDGELWLGRGRFDELSGRVRKTAPVDAEWRDLRYMVFELPGAGGSFTERARRIEAIVAQARWPQLVAVPQAPIADREALRRRFADTIAGGGEGLMLHLASAPFVTGRSDVLRKLKPSLDAEATVVAYRAGNGKYRGRLGALEVRTPEGRRFLLGSGLSDAQRDAPPPIGSRVTYSHRDFTRTGVPRFATFVRLHEAL